MRSNAVSARTFRLVVALMLAAAGIAVAAVQGIQGSGTPQAQTPVIILDSY